MGGLHGTFVCVHIAGLIVGAIPTIDGAHLPAVVLAGIAATLGICAHAKVLIAFGHTHADIVCACFVGIAITAVCAVVARVCDGATLVGLTNYGIANTFVVCIAHLIGSTVTAIGGFGVTAQVGVTFLTTLCHQASAERLICLGTTDTGIVDAHGGLALTHAAIAAVGAGVCHNATFLLCRTDDLIADTLIVVAGFICAAFTTIHRARLTAVVVCGL